MLLPLIAKKGAVADGTLLPKADLLATGLASGADPNVVDATGSTALHYVASLPVRPLGPNETRLTTPRSILMLKTLLAAPALDVNKVNATGYTALHLLVQQARPSVEHLTLLARATKLDYNVIDAAGNTALIH
jgi:ankyrin repeat protein